MKTTRDELAERYPTAAKAAAGGNVRAAVKLFCCECMGGVRADARRCETRECFLWPHVYQAERGAPVSVRRRLHLSDAQRAACRERMARLNRQRQGA